MPPETAPATRKHARPSPVRAVGWRDSLRTRIALWTGMVVLALLVLVVAASSLVARQLVLRNATNDIRNEAREAARRVDDTLRMVTVSCAGMAGTVVRADLSPEQMVSMLGSMVKATPGATGAMLALEPTRTGAVGFARRVTADGSENDFVASGYDYASKPWYRRTLASPQGWWSEPYFNEAAGGVWTTTYNLPIRDDAGDARGMVSMDVLLEGMRERVGAHLDQPGFQISVVAPDGLIAIHPEAGVALHYTLDDYIAQRHRSDLAEVAMAVRQRRPIAYLHADPRTSMRWFTAVEPIGLSGHSLVLSESYSRILERLNQVLLLVVAFGLLAALLGSMAVRRLAGRISRPVEDLAGSAIHLGNGEYDWPVPYRERTDEVGHLARTLDGARTSIQRQLVEIRELGAAEQKRESELSMAHDIQQSMVPPPQRFASVGGLALDAHGLLEPARAVGGDFYSYHESDGVFWFIIGDVSDKGLPAALFMARSDAILTTASHSATTPGEVLAISSRDLAEGNDACMFVTTLVGRIDLRSGDCLLASAGHDAPLLLRADGSIERPDCGSGPPLGIEAHRDFPSWRGHLRPGDSLLAWTDGITEAFDAGDRAFGEDRLSAAVRADYIARENCERLVAAVHAFADGAPQSDDITVLAVRVDRAADNAELPREVAQC